MSIVESDSQDIAKCSCEEASESGMAFPRPWHDDWGDNKNIFSKMLRYGRSLNVMFPRYMELFYVSAYRQDG